MGRVIWFAAGSLFWAAFAFLSNDATRSCEMFDRASTCGAFATLAFLDGLLALYCFVRATLSLAVYLSVEGRGER